jgi:hypothetical protein
MSRLSRKDSMSNRVQWVMRTQPPSDASADEGMVAYLRRDSRFAWRIADPVLADREVVYETDTLVVGDGATPYTGLPRYVRTDPD